MKDVDEAAAGERRPWRRFDQHRTPRCHSGCHLVDGFLFTNYALRHLPVGRVSLYSVLTAPIGVPIAWFVLGESVSTQELIAIPLVVFGVALPAISGAIRSRWSTGKQPPS